MLMRAPSFMLLGLLALGSFAAEFSASDLACEHHGLSSDGCRRDEEAQSLLLLQTSLHVEPVPLTATAFRPPLEAKQHKRGSTVSFWGGGAHPMLAPNCNTTLIPIEMQLSFEGLRKFGYLPPRATCVPHMEPLVLLFNTTRLPDGPPAIGGNVLMSAHPVFWALGAYVLLGCIFLGSIIWTLLSRSDSAPLKKRIVFRPEAEAWQSGYFSWWSVQWATPWIVRWGNAADPHRTQIKAEELGECGDPGDEAHMARSEFDRIWHEDLAARADDRIHLHRVIWKFCTFNKIAQVSCSTGCYQLLLYLGPTFAVEWTLNCISYMDMVRKINPELVTWDSLLVPVLKIILFFTLMPALMVVFNTTTFLLNQRLNVRLQGALGAAIYRKAQRLPATGAEYDLSDGVEEDKAPSTNASWGKNNKRYSLVQLINTDLGGWLMNMQMALAQLIVLIPILITLMFLLARKMGWASVHAGVAAMLTIAIMSFVIRMQVIRLGWAQALAGIRLSFFQETLFGIRIVKSYAWEDAVTKIIRDLRAQELDHLWWYFFWCGALCMLIFSYPRIVVISSISGYVSIYGTLTATEIFVMIQILNAFKGAAQLLSVLLPSVVAMGPSIQRMDKFLKLQEACIPGKKSDCDAVWVSVWAKLPSLPSNQPALRVQGSFAFGHGKPAVLHDIDVCVRQGELVAVLGEVGSGKTTLLHAMLGEMVPLDDARIEVPEKIAFHAQVPVICEATLKENVLYWGDCEQERYNDAIDAACLRQDLQVLPGGDGVPIGSRGIALSGGQRARVSMARAAYTRDADLVLLDDPFSAVDGPTGRHLVEHLLQGPLLMGRTRVVVCQPDSHRIRIFDRVLIVKEGRIVVQGTPAEVVGTPEYQALLSSYDVEFEPVSVSPTASMAEKVVLTSEIRTMSSQQGKLRDEEYEGRADWRTISYFGQMGGWALILGCIFLFFLQVIFTLFSDVVLAHWSNSLMEGESFGSTSTSTHSGYYLNTFLFWFAASNIVFCIGWFLGMTFSINVSRALHNLILARLLQAPIDRFYDRTPVGRIMNRMSVDMTEIDLKLFVKITSTVAMLFWFVVPMGYIHTVMPVVFSLCCTPLYVVTVGVIRAYWNTMVPLRYLTSISRSEVNVYITEAEYGSAMSRAYQVTHAIAKKQTLALNNMLKADFACSCTRRWVVNRLMIMYSFFCTAVALLGILSSAASELGSTSLCLTNIVFIIMQVELYLDQATAAQYEFISMNRLHEYTDIVQERAARLESDDKLRTVVTTAARSDLGNLEIFRDEDGGLRVVRTPPPLKTCQPCTMCINGRDVKGDEPHQVLLVQTADRRALIAAPGSSLGDLAPNCAALKSTNAEHRLIMVNSAGTDAMQMAEELCYGHAESVFLRVQSGWVADGARVVISDLVAGYGDVPVDVLKGVSLTIERRCKVAIAGTTGCGKSTMLLCFLRILEPRSGKIEVEGVNIQDMGLHTLRRCLGLVPQDPVLFSGTIRNNLDPYEEYSDDQIWKALSSVQLNAFVTKLGAGIDSAIKPDGENLSFGQKQLMCIARMVLRQPPLLLLDEATSAIDPHTQELVQTAIRVSFPDSTIVAVAHRLETIMDFDMVVVMERGHIMERGAVKELANLKGGIFAKMLASRRH